MKICSKCNSENLDHAKFCHNCGEAINDTLYCPTCKEKLEGDFRFCPHCGTNLKSLNNGSLVKPAKVKKESFLNKPKLHTIILNSVLILFCSILCLTLLGSLSKLPGDTDSDKANSTIFDYFDSTFDIFNGLKFDDIEDDTNILDIYIANLDGSQLDLYKVVVILVVIVSLTMFILPAVLLGISIYNLVKFNKSDGYKKFFSWFVFLPLLLVLIINSIGFKVGSGLVLYILFTGFALVSLIVVHYVFEEKQINLKSLILKSISALSIFVIFLLVMTNFASFKDIDHKFNVGFGDILSNIELLFESKEPWLNYYAYQFTRNLRDFETFSFYFQYIIPVFQITAIVFALCALMSELKKSLLHTNKTRAGLYLILSFVFYVIFVISAIAFVILVNGDMRDLGEITLSLSPSMFIVLVLLLGVTIFRNIIKKEYENLEY